MEPKKSKVSQFITFLNQPINSAASKVILAYVASFVVLELLAYMVGGLFTIIESRLWLLGGILCYGFITICFLKTLYYDVKRKNFVSIVGLLAFIIFFGYFVGNINYSDVNPDATQQMAAGISSFQQKDWNFTGSAFLGYPNRQYVIAAIPALIFGRSIYTLHIGFAIPFFLGMIMMYLGLREWCQKSEVSDKAALVALYAMLAFRFVAEYFMNFEQAITPIALTMMAVGMFLKFVKNPSCLYLIFIVWLGSFCAGSYTPVLASLGLLVVFLVMYAIDLYQAGSEKYVSVEYPIEVIKSIGYALAGIVSVTLTILLHTKAEKLEQTREEVSIVSYCFECIRDFFFDKDAVFLGGVGLLILAYMIFSLTFHLKLHDFMIAIWVLIVVVLANYMTGYTTYQKAWILQRTLIIVPVLIAGITIAWLPYLKNMKIEVGSVLLMIVLGLTGMYNFKQVHQSFTYFNYVYPMKYMLSATADEIQGAGLGREDEFNLILYTDNNLQTNLECYTRFLYPNAHSYIGTCSDMVTEEDSTLPTIVFSEQMSVKEKYHGELKEYTYFDQRYKTKITWYTIGVEELGE